MRFSIAMIRYPYIIMFFGLLTFSIINRNGLNLLLDKIEAQYSPLKGLNRILTVNEIHGFILSNKNEFVNQNQAANLVDEQALENESFLKLSTPQEEQDTRFDDRIKSIHDPDQSDSNSSEYRGYDYDLYKGITGALFEFSVLKSSFRKFLFYSALISCSKNDPPPRQV